MKTTPEMLQVFEELVNHHSLENGSNTPDFILGEFLTDCLIAWNKASRRREMWYGAHLAPGVPKDRWPHPPKPVQAPDSPPPERYATPRGLRGLPNPIHEILRPPNLVMEPKEDAANYSATTPPPPEMITVPKAEFNALLCAASEFLSDWRKGDFSLGKLARLDAEVIEKSIRDLWKRDLHTYTP